MIRIALFVLISLLTLSHESRTKLQFYLVLRCEHMWLFFFFTTPKTLVLNTDHRQCNSQKSDGLTNWFLCVISLMRMSLPYLLTSWKPSASMFAWSLSALLCGSVAIYVPLAVTGLETNYLHRLWPFGVWATERQSPLLAIKRLFLPMWTTCKLSRKWSLSCL